MFDSLREAWHKATHPFEGFMEDLWTVWKQDVGRAILVARKSWQAIPASIVQQGAELEAQGRAAQAGNTINDIVAGRLGALGIFPGKVAGTGGLLMNPDQALFVLTMAGIGANRGDQLAMPGMEQFTQGVLRGQIDPVQALIACTPAISRQQLAYVLQASQMAGMPQILQVIRVIAVIQAATALPRGQLSEFVPDVPAVAGH